MCGSLFYLHLQSLCYDCDLLLLHFTPGTKTLHLQDHYAFHLCLFASALENVQPIPNFRVPGSAKCFQTGDPATMFHKLLEPPTTSVVVVRTLWLL